MIDGLNEVDRLTGQGILEAVAPVTAIDSQLSFLITDRLVRRTNVSTFWRYATLGPVPPEVVREVTGSLPTTEAMSIPFYLRRHSQGGVAHEILRESITRFVTGEDFAALAEVSFRSYEEYGRRSLDREMIVASVGRGVWQTMVDARFVVEEKRAAPVRSANRTTQANFRFEHHLLQDFLAGLHLATHRELWTDHGFDTLSLKASSFDALALSLTQVLTKPDAEELVETVYNWNFYAAAYMLQEDRAGIRQISEAVGVALLGALAEKRFDDVVPTVVRVEDALRVNQSSLAAGLLEARDRSEVVSALLDHLPNDQPDWFQTWLEQFSRPDEAIAQNSDVEALRLPSPMVGWGASNALRRFGLSQQIGAEIRRLLSHPNDTVRWRAAHALGPHASRENFEALSEALAAEPDESWVAYGALRAIFEQIRKMPGRERPGLLRTLTDQIAGRIGEPGPLRAETMRCVEVAPLPEHWHQDIEPLLTLLWETADDSGAEDLAALAGRLRQRKRGPSNVD
ncbi:hypothetical protein EAX62_02005 [Tessaracoccus antarcticus]|uniref:HEAT repeat domain-containing protein n=1 Tax=Tessaracoccus antarcticus TaxID=2479848 RepID=A0A3M0G8T9_9ACTN|nr:hypothetical protein EAX62_02005 [Tessaracoccus antarcticus]